MFYSKAHILGKIPFKEYVFGMVGKFIVLSLTMINKLWGIA